MNSHRSVHMAEALRQGHAQTCRPAGRRLPREPDPARPRPQALDPAAVPARAPAWGETLRRGEAITRPQAGADGPPGGFGYAPQTDGPEPVPGALLGGTSISLARPAPARARHWPAATAPAPASCGMQQSTGAPAYGRRRLRETATMNARPVRQPPPCAERLTASTQRPSGGNVCRRPRR